MTVYEAYITLNLSLDFLPKGAPNRPGGNFDKTSITIHNTGNAQKGANAAMHARYMRGADARERKVSWHLTVDDTQVIKHLPYVEETWHCGRKAGNRSSISMELCMHSDGDRDAIERRAALLCALIMHEDKRITEIKRHYDWSRKHCPANLLDSKRWKLFLVMVESFRAALKKGSV